MKILHINTDDMSGGAARAAARLHVGLIRLGHDSSMLVAQRTSDAPVVASIFREASAYKTLVRALARRRILKSFAPYAESRPAGLDRFSEDRSEYAIDLETGIPGADIINLHWVAGFIDYQKFFARYGKRRPIVWTMHDMNAFTGGCHYDDGCGKFTASCGSCPQLGSTQENDLSREVWSRKQNAFSGLDPGDLHIVADSKWLAGEVSRSSLLRKFPITFIHYGLNTEIFVPRSKSHARVALGIPVEARVIMFAADATTIRRKGLATLVEAINGMAGDSNLWLISVGKGMSTLSAAIPHLHYGHVNSDVFLSLLYSAADVFVIPSAQEAFGQTALEAMACGTPVTGSRVGGIAEIVHDDETGYLVPPLSPVDLREAIAKLLNDPVKRGQMSEQCRRVVLDTFSLEIQARHYETLYRDISSRT